MELQKSNDPFEANCMMSFLNNDLILLENQIPWLVLDCLFQKIMSLEEIVELPLITLVTDFFSDWWFFTEPSTRLDGTWIPLLDDGPLVLFKGIEEADDSQSEAPSSFHLKFDPSSIIF
ncbi:hypothetical protein F8388_010322 [Cannabis sativa]|uniref:Uncharacterized protein n=1 Tax=Cannabis sativa TaxID=3483 RepID=A0A7J6GS55_CANSA|nr:hypothetical protein F8388_010322 [Cannabis sativa]KAF4397466.1 hypothetical protein G4B88_027206 [Cannabis sativa]